MAVAGYVLTLYARIDIDVLQPSRRSEGICNSAGMKPGMLARMDTTKKWVPHATQYGKGEFALVNLDSLQGKEIAETTYAVGDRMSLLFPKAGDLVALLIKDGQNIASGDQLVSNGDGTFRKVAAGTDHIFAVADDDLNLTAAGANHLVVARVVA